LHEVPRISLIYLPPTSSNTFKTHKKLQKENKQKHQPVDPSATLSNTFETHQQYSKNLKKKKEAQTSIAEGSLRWAQQSATSAQVGFSHALPRPIRLPCATVFFEFM
jgi:hypothetical protein